MFSEAVFKYCCLLFIYGSVKFSNLHSVPFAMLIFILLIQISACNFITSVYVSVQIIMCSLMLLCPNFRTKQKR